MNANTWYEIARHLASALDLHRRTPDGKRKACLPACVGCAALDEWHGHSIRSEHELEAEAILRDRIWQSGYSAGISMARRRQGVDISRLADAIHVVGKADRPEGRYMELNSDQLAIEVAHRYVVDET